MSETESVTVHRGAPHWWNGDGWYWMHDEYPEDSGFVGAFDTALLAVQHAERCGYAVTMMRPDSPEWRPKYFALQPVRDNGCHYVSRSVTHSSAAVSDEE